MSKLHFEKISMYGRAAEPVTASIPFARGALTGADHLRIRDAGAELPAQKRVLSSWPDGSVKWLLVHLQPDLPANAGRQLSFEITDSAAPPPSPTLAVTVKERPDGVAVDTGSLRFLVPNGGFLPAAEIELNGKRLWEDEPLRGFCMQCGGRELASAEGHVEVEIEEAGPLRAVVLVRGKHLDREGNPFIDFRGRVTAYVGKSYIEVEHQFLHCEDEGELELREARLDFRPAQDGSAKLALGEGYYRTDIRESEEPLEFAITADTLLYQSNEHYTDCFYGDFWADWRSGSAGVAVSVFQAHQNFPKKLRVTQEGIECSLFPEDAPAATVYQGMGKTHRMMLHFHDGELPLEEISSRSLQYQLPDRPTLSPEWYGSNNPWGLDFFPAKLPDRLMVRLAQLHDSRPAALGMFHLGDAPDAGYTDQGRGRGSAVWVNNEYDRAHACTLFYGLCGERRVLESGFRAAQHWLDVDLCHYSEDPLRHGGLIIHSADHVTAGVGPSHEWVEGFLDYYHLTGRREALEAATMVAENIMRHMAKPHMREPGASSAREGGWALKAMVPMWLQTGEERYRAEAKRLAELFIAWHEEFGAMLAPYTSHSMPRVPFMVFIAANALARYLLVEEDERVKKLIVQTADDMIEYCIGPGGLFYYKELPSLRVPAPTMHAIEGLAHAFRLTGERRYLEVAARQFEAFLEGGVAGRGGPKRYLERDRAVVHGNGNGRGFASTYTSVILFASAAGPEGMLDQFEYAV